MFNLNPKKKLNCIFNVCVVLVEGKECGTEFIHNRSTSHMNDHLFIIHEKEEFRPKRIHVKPDEREINELMAKFIVNSNSAFRIVEDKYLKVIITF